MLHMYGHAQVSICHGPSFGAHVSGNRAQNHCQGKLSSLLCFLLYNSVLNNLNFFLLFYHISHNLNGLFLRYFPLISFITQIYPIIRLHQGIFPVFLG